jgi:4-amino-4-deoxy-L-arabinose transferase-like glycosyltransferase
VRTAAIAYLALLYFFKLGAGSLWDNSEPQYGEIVKEMLRGGDWLTLHKDLQPWFIHPPLWFWVTAASAKIFGLNELGLRVPSAAFGIACALAVYYAARRLYGETAGVTAMLAIGTSLEFLVMGRLAIQDTMLIFFMTVGTFWSFFAIRDGDVRAFWIATVAIALGTLVKGPVAALLPFLTLLAWTAWANRWRGLRPMPWVPAILAYILIAGAWFGIETAVNGERFLVAYFGLSNVGRFMSPFENQPGPPWFYIPYVIVGFFPFIAFVPSAAVRAWRELGDDGKYLIASFAVPFLFFSIAQTKLPNYIAAAFPPLAVMVGELFGRAASAGSARTVLRPLMWLAIVFAALLAAFDIYTPGHAGTTLAPYLSGLDVLVTSVALIGVATFVIARRYDRAWVGPWGLSAAMGAFILTIAIAILPQVEASAKPMKAMAADVVRYQHPGERICFDGVKQGFSLDFYTDGPPVASIGHNTDDAPPAKFFPDPESSAICVVSPQAYVSLAKEGFPMRIIERTPTLWLAERAPASTR